MLLLLLWLLLLLLLLSWLLLLLWRLLLLPLPLLIFQLPQLLSLLLFLPLLFLLLPPLLLFQPRLLQLVNLDGPALAPWHTNGQVLLFGHISGPVIGAAGRPGQPAAKRRRAARQLPSLSAHCLRLARPC